MSGVNFSGVLAGESQEKLSKQGGFTLLPEGWHVGHITGCDMMENKKKTGSYLMVTLQTPDGVEVIDRINLQNPSEKVEHIARCTMAKIGVALGVDIETLNSDDLVGREIGFRVKVSEFKSNRDGKMLQSNSVTSYRASALGENHAEAVHPVSQDPGPGNTPPPVNTGQAPW